MNRITNVLTKSVTVAAAASVLAFAVAGSANAATPPASPPATAVSAGSAADTQGFNLHNDSAERFIFQKVTGRLPAPPTDPVLPGDSVNFELPATAPYVGHSSGDAFYLVMSPQNTPTATIDLHFDAANLNDSKVTVTDSAGHVLPNGQYLGITGSSYTDYTFTDADGWGNTDVTLTPGVDGWTQDQVSALAKQQCTGSSSCSFDNVTTTSAQASAVALAKGYNDNSPAPASLGTSKGYEATTTNTWDTTFSANVEIMGAVTLGVSHSVGYSVSTSNNFSTSFTFPDDEGQTAVIFGYAPMINSAGDFTTRLGNTTFHLNGASFSVPDPHGVMSYFGQEYPGDQLANFDLDPGVNNNAPSQPATVARAGNSHSQAV